MTGGNKRTSVVLLVMGALVVGVGLGYLLGSFSMCCTEGGKPAGDVLVEESGEQSGESDGVGRRGDDPGDCTQVLALNKKLKAQVALLESAGKSDDDSAHSTGESMPDKYQELEWPEDIPKGSGPDEYEDVMTAVLKEGADKVDLVEMNCEEPPCMTLLRLRPLEGGIKGSDDYQDNYMKPLIDSKAWKDHFGTSMGWAGKVGKCKDGSSELVAFLYHVPESWDEGLANAIQLRNSIRQEDMLENYQCLPTD